MDLVDVICELVSNIETLKKDKEFLEWKISELEETIKKLKENDNA